MKFTDVLVYPCLLFVLGAAGRCNAQFRSMSTIAGNGRTGEVVEQGMATAMAISNPFGIQLEADGSLIIASYDQHVLYRLDSAYRNATRIAGTGEKGLSGARGGRPLKIAMNQPHEVQVDQQGNIYVADTMNHRVGVIDQASGRWRTVAGTGEAGFSGDGGPATQAKFNQAYSIAVSNDRMFIADLKNHRIRELDLSTGRIQTVCGNGAKGMPADGEVALRQPLAGPRSLAVDEDNLWIVLREGNSIWRMDRHRGKIYHVAGSGEKGFSGDGGQAKKAKFNGPKGIAVDPGVALYVADTENHAVRRIDLAKGTIDTVVGSEGKPGFNGDGGEVARRMLNRPHGVCLLPSGELLIGDSENHRVRLARP